MPIPSNSPSREVLQKEYWDDKMSLPQIGQKHGVSDGAILKWLKKYDIPRRSLHEASINSSNPTRFKKGLIPHNQSTFITKEELNELYTNQKLSCRQIAERIHSTRNAIKHLMIKYHIKGRVGLPIGSPAWNNRHLNFNEIKEMYESGVASSEIAHRLGVNRSTITDLLTNNGMKLPKNPRPNALEKRIISVIQQYNLPYEYTGDSKIWVNKMNPDFIDKKHRVILEVFGLAWHSPLFSTYKFRRKCLLSERERLFSEAGWKMKVLWDYEMKEMSDEEIISRLL